MIVFRCTDRVIRRFRIHPVAEDLRSTGLLGDWYANLLNVGSSRFVLCLSERTLLPVILPARNKIFPNAFGDFLRPILDALGAGSPFTESELHAAQEVAFAKTRNRKILGALNDFAFNAQYLMHDALPKHSPFEAALELAQMPSKPIGYESPARAFRSLFLKVDAAR